MRKSGIKQLLAELELELRLKEAPILNRLYKGRTEEELQEMFSSMDIPLDVYTLYEWRDGTDTANVALGQCWLFKMGAIIPAKKAIEYYRKFVNRDEFWIEGLFPLFESLGGDYYLLDVNTSSPTYGMIYFYSRSAVDFETIISRYDSIWSLFTTILECFRKGVYSYDRINKTLVFQPQLEREINRKNNPRSSYWTLFK